MPSYVKVEASRKPIEKVADIPEGMMRELELQKLVLDHFGHIDSNTVTARIVYMEWFEMDEPTTVSHFDTQTGEYSFERITPETHVWVESFAIRYNSYNKVSITEGVGNFSSDVVDLRAIISTGTIATRRERVTNA